MLVLLTAEADEGAVLRQLQELGQWTRLNHGDGQRVVVIEPHSAHVETARLRQIPGVAAVLQRQSPHPLVDAQMGRPVQLAEGLSVGAGLPTALIAGPCSAESEETAWRAAELVARGGGRLLRGGAFKPRTSPYSFQGAGSDALRWLGQAARAHDLALVTEVMSQRDVDVVAEHAAVLQIGARNMQNYALLKEAGRARRPVLLKRGMAARIEEWLLAAEYLLSEGCPGVVFCERGVAGFDPSTRYLLDLGAVALLSQVHQLPVAVDPSHACGRRDLIPALSRAALSVGAALLMVEVHPDPAQARSDRAQALDPSSFLALTEALQLTPGPTRSPVGGLHG